jgi:hydroxyethylthiazole kinase-like uncharacterized protein yjeF
MGAADRRAIESGTPSLDLMERAGRAVGRAALEVAGGAYGRRVVILCGKGNNGGDGFVAARLIAEAGGFPVVFTLEATGSLSDDARANFERLRGVRVVPFTPQTLYRELRRADAAIDAMVGTGFRGSLEGSMAAAATALNESTVPVIATDIPSGVNAEFGTVSGVAVKARITVTMGAMKSGLVLWPGAHYSGEIVVAEIGVDLDSSEPDLLWVTQDAVAAALPKRSRQSDKRSVGTVLVVAGSVGMAGAPALVARGALRGGAGLVTIASPEPVAVTLHQVVSEGTTIPLPYTKNGSISAEAVPMILERADKFDAIAIGPGLSTEGETFEAVHQIVSELDKPVVLDADGINAFKGDPGALASRPAPTVLTPHIRELARLLGKEADQVESDRIGAARQAARDSGATILLKGFRTLVAEPSGATYVIGTGGPALATGGSGDVLTGLISALLASMGPENAVAAAWAGAWIHGRAGDMFSDRFGDRGLVAGDLAEALPEVFGSLTFPGPGNPDRLKE